MAKPLTIGLPIEIEGSLPILLPVVALAHTTSTQQPRTHDLALTPDHVHWGYFDSRVPPVLRIASGDRVRVETMIAGGLQRVRLAGVPSLRFRIH